MKDINPGIRSSNPFGLVNFNGTLLFIATDAAGAKKLWRSDGTEAGTAPVADTGAGDKFLSPQSLTVLGDRVSFLATNPGTAPKLYQSDGTTSGTFRVPALDAPNAPVGLH